MIDQNPQQLIEAARSGAGPVISRAGDGEIEVTFVAQGDHEALGLQSLFGGAMQPFLPMERLPDSDVWARTVRAPAAVRTTYAFLPDPPQVEIDLARINEILAELMSHLGRIQPDPLNPRTTTLDIGGGAPVTTSVLEGPDAPAQPLSRPRPGQAEGAWEEHKVDTARVEGPRRVWVRTPPGFDGAQPHALLIALDGQAWRENPTLATVLDNLAVDGAVRPLIAVLVDSLGMLERMVDLGLSDDFADFLAHDLVPWARERFPIGPDAADVVVAGMSMGGLTTAFAGLRHPDVLGNLLVMSPSLFYARDEQPAWLLARYAEAERLPDQTHLEVGSLEDALAPLTRQLHELLVARGADVTFTEYVGGHDVPCWEGSLADGLQRLVPPTDSR